MKVFTRQEVSAHKTIDDLWLIVNDHVYDLTDFVKFHPGGAHTLLDYAGKEATEVFYSLHTHSILDKYHNKFCVGKVDTPAKFKIKVPQPGDIESTIPYAEPPAWSGMKSPYYNQSHVQFRQALRIWLDENIRPQAETMEKSGKLSKKFLKKCCDAGLLAMHIVPYPSKYTDKPIFGGVDPKDFDIFHEMILYEELTRLGRPWLVEGIHTGFVIGLPPVKYFALPHIRDRVMRECINGEKRICLAISEPYAGSDVAGIRTIAKKSSCGKFYIVTGIKKWITTSYDADYFTTAVRTSKKGISVLLIERGPGVTVKKQQILGGKQANCAGTSWVIFENVKVPIENLIGKENQGFKVLMYNFNHERWYISVMAVAQARVAVTETLKWCHLRKAFGRNLTKQPVIRNQLSHMSRKVESAYAWQEHLTFQMANMTPQEQNRFLGGPMALFKLHAGRIQEEVASEAVQILGGRGLTQTGHGAVVSRIWQMVKYTSILGGSDDILADLAAKQAIRAFPADHARL